MPRRTDLHPHQTSLIPRARRDDPETSHAAARSVQPHLRENQQALLSVLEGAEEGYTDEELFDSYLARYNRGIVPGQSPSGLRTRRKELVKLGFAEHAGCTRTLRSGRQGIVWKAASREAD